MGDGGESWCEGEGKKRKKKLRKKEGFILMWGGKKGRTVHCRGRKDPKKKNKVSVAREKNQNS